MTIAQVCKLSQEVERNELLTTVVLDGVYRAERKEADGDFVLRVTYPTEVVKLLIQQVTEKLSGKTVKGGVVVRGSYGSGKSHALLTLFHLCSDAERANEWCEKWGMNFKFPKGVRVAAVQLVAERPENLWTNLMKRLGETELLGKISGYPTRDNWMALAKNQPTVLLIDELEGWYESLTTSERAAQRNALQNLMEVAEEDLPLAVIVSVYGINDEVMAVLNRTQPPILDVGTAVDRWKIVRHRLVDSLDEQKVKGVVQRYMQVYEKVRNYLPVSDFDELRREMERYYPFHPVLLKKMFEVYGLMPRHEMTRGVIGICATLLRKWAKERDMVLAGDLDVLEEEIASDLRKLDSQRVENAQKDLQDRCTGVEYASEFLGAALLYSVGNQQGITEGELWFATLRPERNINDLQDALEELVRKALFLEKQNGNFLVTVEESLEKRVEQEARTLIAMPEGRQKAAERLKGKIREEIGIEVTFYPDEEIRIGGGLRYVISLQPLMADVETLRPLFSDNTIVLLAPRQSVTRKVTEDDDWLLTVARVLVCEELLKQRHKRQQELRRLKGQFESDLERLIRNNFANWLRLSRLNELGEEPRYVVRSEQVALRKEEVDRKLRETFDLNAFKDAIVKILRAQGRDKRKGEEEAGLTIRQVRNWLRREIGLPILGEPTESAFKEAIKAMVADENSHTGAVVRVGKSIYGYPPNIALSQEPQDGWKIWLKEFGPEPPALPDVKAKVRDELQRVGDKGASVNELQSRLREELQEIRRAVAELVNLDDAILETDDGRYPDDGHLPVDKVSRDAKVWLKEFAPPDDRKARSEILRLVSEAGEDGISWGEVKQRLFNLGCDEKAILRALERLHGEGKVAVAEDSYVEDSYVLEISVATLADSAKLRRPKPYKPIEEKEVITTSPEVPLQVTIQPYRLPDSIDLWLGELRNKLSDKTQIERVVFTVQTSVSPESVRKIAKVQEEWKIQWQFEVAASKDEILRLCEEWEKILPSGWQFVVSTEIEGRVKKE